MAIKILFLVAIAAFASAINGRSLPFGKTATDVETTFLHPHFPPYRGAFGGAGAGFGGFGAGFGGRYGNGGVGGGFGGRHGNGRLGGGFGNGDESSAGGGAGTGGIGSLESGGDGGGNALGHEVEGGSLP